MFSYLLDKEEGCSVFAGLEASAILSIDLDAVATNYRILVKKVGSACRVGAVVKANAYGIGARRVSDTLLDQGCKTLITANIEEALDLYAYFHDTGRDIPEIVVLGGVLPNMEQVFVASGIIPVLNSLDQISNYGRLARKIGRKLPCYIHFDTGMSRLGLDAQETQYILTKPEILYGLNICCIMSHLSCADEVGHIKTEEQFVKFEQLQQQLPDRISKTCRFSLSNSSGIFRGVDLHYSMVRAGMAIYGLNPTPETKNPMKPVVRLKASIIQSRVCAVGDSVGYGSSYRVKDVCPVVTVGVGYADGLPRLLSNNGKVYINGKSCPIIGRVSMDVITVDISKLTENPPRVGDWVEIIGDSQSVDDIASQCQTIGYEVLTNIGSTPAKRLRREYNPVSVRAWNMSKQQKVRTGTL